MSVRDWLRPPRQVVAVFAAVVVVSAGALGLLSWQLLEQDRLLEVPRRRGLLEAAADDAVRTISATLGQLDAIASGGGDGTPPEGVSVLAIAPAGTTARFASSLPFLPTRGPLREAAASVFFEASALEFRGANPDRARAAYEGLAANADRAVRATALARLAAVQLKLGDSVAALRSYDALASLDDVGVGGLPGSLVAAVGRASALAATARLADLRDAAAALSRDLARGRWPLVQSEYDYYAAQAAAWAGAPVPVDADALARADAAAWLWRQRASLPAAGRRLLAQPRGAVVIVWRSSGNTIEAAVGGPAFLATLVAAAVPREFSASVRDLEGRSVIGTTSSGNDVATRVASPDGVPWTLQLSSAPLSPTPVDTLRRRLLILVVGVMVLVLAAGWYFIARALARELRVARLQNDFVASVSHEFRSPLTSLAHVAELLSKDRLPTDGQRRQAYDVLVGDTARLRDLVEHLLDFGRFDTGAVALRLERLDVRVLVADLTGEAQRRIAAQGYTVDFDAGSEPLFADADKEALSRAIWNLIDNAVKYSPDCRTVWVSVAREGDDVAITVRDRGLGIPAEEQREIFQRFVRGAESRSRRIRGTGIGLALARQIVAAHGGEIGLASAPGQGSRFVIRIRAAGDAT